MSHYTVLVTGPDIDEALRPFDENRSSRARTEFVDLGEEIKRLYETGLDRNGAEFKNKYANLDEFAIKHYQIREEDVALNRYGYWRDANAKWDWYSVGGRWSGFFKLKSGERSDSCLKSEVDLIGMDKEAAEEAAESYDRYIKVIEGHPPGLSKEKVAQKYGADTDEASKFYESQPALKALDEAGISIMFVCPFHEFRGSKEEYVDRSVRLSFATFAILHNGTWTEKGEMGWFGQSLDKHTGENWAATFRKFWNFLPDDTQVTLVDCHI